ncbi:metallophosphoesterase family protein [Legionella impletisoli]|uniref:2,3-bisphosphoglycerate-independent phosphoglycerate mutase n=1 Tax=Legionella impletisoli TaxID=343510 RepID=A0A917JXK3_9GAMM|nr:metallophosphoesterase [Legionella impletisoli]GGI89055.1 2,3-bisphosphoglycerate-independent phosphoglycerate mutase [Legionella impletisoli]
MRTLWLTDLHVNRLDEEHYTDLFNRIQASEADGIWITGDIGDPPLNWIFLEDLFCKFTKPIYFVLGNHDYYGLKVDEARQKARNLSYAYPNAHYLTSEAGFVFKEYFITGIGCWGNTGNIPLRENTWDSDAIYDLLRLNLEQLKTKVNQLGEQDASILLQKCAAGITKTIKTLVIFTHVPPIEAMQGRNPVRALEENRTVYYSFALSNALKQLLETYPEIDIRVYSGHLHQAQAYQITDRLHGHVAEAYNPSLPFNWIML